MYNKADFKNGFVQLEKEILSFWTQNGIIKKSFAANPDGEYFAFYDGPPTANGKPHTGHVETRAIKDIIPRYKVMKGYKVLRKAGWDTHGLPVELEVEKALGITGKAQIENYGVEKFIKKCKDSVFKYVGMWREMSEKIGFWLDMDDPYVTYHNSYIESVWWSLKQMWDKGYVYKGHKIMPYCPRCGTSLSSHEVAQGYKEISDKTLVAKFKAVGQRNLYILAWTTTPWTLPSNIALAVNRKYDYVEVAQDDERYILAKGCLSVLKGDYEILREFPGEALLGAKYEQLLPFVRPEGRAFEVIHGDFVTLGEGTGVVHIAPSYGEDDNIVCKQNGMANLHLVSAEGKFVSEVAPYAGIPVRNANRLIIADMKRDGKVYRSDSHVHSYPHCWRCDTPLLYYPKDSWFISSTKYRDLMVKNNRKINWYPDNIKDGRFGKFLEGVIDWAISRERYWGTPLPIWECSCGYRDMIGSVAQLREMGGEFPEDLELHKPYIDAVSPDCPECGGKGSMKRVSEVIDCWYDSGSMPFAQFHYPFENQDLFEKNFPAGFISEAIDQTRGWFYSLHNISNAVFERNCFENCIVMGHVQDIYGKKMSKHLGNIIEPNELLDSVGADATRWFFYISSALWAPKRLSAADVSEYQRKFLLTLSNVYSFYVLYADLDSFDALKYKDFVSENVMDRWIISKLNTVIAEVDAHLDGYRITQAANALQDFVDDLSNWYVRRNRARFWQPELNADKIGAFTTLYRALVAISKISAPFVPFISEAIYRSLVISLDPSAEESVHLCRWPESDPSLLDKKLEEEMALAYAIVKLGRSARSQANIKNRQPLSGMLVSAASLPDYYSDIIKDELNIKTLTFGADLAEYVNFDVKPNLPVLGKAYGRYIPAIRKELAAHKQMELAQKINSGGELVIKQGGAEIILNKDNLLVQMNGLSGYAFAAEGANGVVLDATVTQELKNEGYIREILSKIQNMRKDSGFEVSDNIKIYFAGNSRLEELIKSREEYISGETLALGIIFDVQRDYSKAKINDESLDIALERL
ncbi:MAG: isoleucine--tRNA ligase [Oscillospiraceae bacterium]|nr:isoleucine--tRNA ligase [Oscillospiraceae bacterium]